MGAWAEGELAPGAKGAEMRAVTPPGMARAEVRPVHPAMCLSQSPWSPCCWMVLLSPLTKVPTRRGCPAALEGGDLRSWALCLPHPQPLTLMPPDRRAWSSLEFAASLALTCSVGLLMRAHVSVSACVCECVYESMYV